MNAAPVFLLVEPLPILQSVLQKWLQYKFGNAHVLIAENGVEALRLAVQQTPTQVLVEINLPDETGFELLHQLRHSLPTPGLSRLAGTTTASITTESSLQEQMDMLSGIN